MSNDKVTLIFMSEDDVPTIVYAGGTTAEVGEWSMVEADIALRAAQRHGFDNVFGLPYDRVLSVLDEDTQNDGGQGGGDGDQDTGETGEGEGESDGDGDADDDGEQGEGEGEPQEGDGSGEQEEGMEFQEGEGEGDPFGDPFADDLWPVIRPRVVEIAESRAEQAYVAANRYSRLNGGSGRGDDGSGGSRTIRISGVKAGEVKGVTHFQFERVLRAVARGCHVYLPGPPGTGKSHMALQVAEALGRDFSVSSFSPMSTESKLIGFRDANGNTVRTQYRERYEFGGIWCGDELDNSNPAVVAGLNSGLANGFMEFPDGTVARHADFVCIATANTLGTGPTAEFAGRQKLDPATLNRFVKIYIGTDEAMETMLVEQIIGAKMAERWLGKVRHIRRAVDEHRIKHFVTMRDSLQGARLIAPGDGKFSIEEALEMTILAVLTDDQRDKIKSSR